MEQKKKITCFFFRDEAHIGRVVETGRQIAGWISAVVGTETTREPDIITQGIDRSEDERKLE
jgi:hypothetical protein